MHERATADPAIVGGGPERDVAPVVRLYRWLVARRGVDLAAALLQPAVIAACVVFILVQMAPSLLVADTTPAGGDMGAHVWGPAYLRDSLLPEGRLTGWSPDWYAGFPAYQFYMVVPALLIVAVNAGAQGWAALAPLAVGLALVGVAVGHRTRRWRRVAAVIAPFVLLLGVGLPYGVAFKWVTVLGLVALPVCCYVFGRLADLPFPAPVLLAVASVPFLFNREPLTNGTGNIIGGNVASTLAGEFSFSLSLAVAVLYLGFLLRGLRTGRHRALCAGLLALVALCHIIPAIFAAAATVIAFLVSPGEEPKGTDARWVQALRVGAIVAVTGAAAVVVLALDVPGPDVAALPAGVGSLVSVLVVALAGYVAWAAGVPRHRARLVWLLPTLPVALLLTAFWTGPFVARREFLNDMGWEKIPTPGNTWRDVLLPDGLIWAIALGGLGIVVSILLRSRAGLFLGALGATLVLAVVVAPTGRLWNARLLPFVWLCVLLLAGIAVAEVGRAIAALVARHPERPVHGVSLATPGAALAATLVLVGLPLGVLPESVSLRGNELVELGDTEADGTERWLGLEVASADRNVVRDWARWNYTGYERKDAYPEYHDLITTMDAVGDESGCGRAMWEYDSVRLGTYGTPMAPMLLPFFTDGCIGSMEGLFFEASATTPYHFLNQRALSTDCSCAQRDLPYGEFDIALGVEQLQFQGVRYYLAQTPAAVEAAATEPDLIELAVSGPWHVYEVADSELVTPLENEPTVLTGVSDGRDWLGPATKFFTETDRWDVLYASDGPDSWARTAVCEAPAAGAEGADDDAAAPVEESERFIGLDVCETPEAEPAGETEVSAIVATDDAIRFEVTEIGVPVLVKASYFPNWRVSGAEGPFRVAPNLMVVVPTETTVELTYGQTPVEYGSYALTALGLAGVVVLARRRTRLTPLGYETVDLAGAVAKRGRDDDPPAHDRGGSPGWGPDPYGGDRPFHGPPVPASWSGSGNGALDDRWRPPGAARAAGVVGSDVTGDAGDVAHDQAGSVSGDETSHGTGHGRDQASGPPAGHVPGDTPAAGEADGDAARRRAGGPVPPA